MGKLLSLLARDDSSTCCSPKSYDVFLDFENAAPTETEREVYDEVDRVLKESEAVLEEIQCYKVSQQQWPGGVLIIGVTHCHWLSHLTGSYSDKDDSGCKCSLVLITNTHTQVYIATPPAG